jgi:hypothetical protein
MCNRPSSPAAVTATRPSKRSPSFWRGAAAHSRDQLLPTYTQSGTATGQYTPYSGTAWDSAGYAYSLTITPDATASPTSVTADYWDQGIETNTATYSGNVARGTFGNTQSHHDQETNWHSGTYTTNERGTPAPDAPPGGGGGGGGSSSGSSTSSSTSIPSTYTLTAHGSGQLQTVRTDDELWQGATSATLVTSSMTVAITGDGGGGSTLTETFAAPQGWAVPFTAGPPTVTNVGGVTGAKSRTVTEGNNYTLSASQNYLVSGTSVAGGTDTYSLHHTDSTAAHDGYIGSSSNTGAPPMFNTVGGSTFGFGAGSYTTSLAQADDANYTVDRLVTSGYSWSGGLPTGSAADSRAKSGTLAATQTLWVSQLGYVTVSPGVTRPVQMATVVMANHETLSASQAVADNYSGSFLPQTHTTSASQSWGDALVSLHADQYLTLTPSPSHSQTLSALSDKWMSDFHSATWAWEEGVGGNAAATATNAYRDDQTFAYVNREATVGHTYSMTSTNTSRYDTTTDVRRTYTVPTSIITTSNIVIAQQLVGATYRATGSETASYTASQTAMFAGGSDFDWHRGYSSQTFTVHTTETPATTLTTSTRWMVGQDDHQNSASHTYDLSSTMVGYQEQDTSTHTFTLTLLEHQLAGTTTTQDSIDHRDYQSVSLSTSQTNHKWYDDAWVTVDHRYTASLSENGPGQDVVSTLDTSDTFAYEAMGAKLGVATIAAFYSQTVNSRDTKHEVRTPIGGGATRTAGTTSHNSLNALSVYYHPNGATPKYTISTVSADHRMTLTNVGSVTENLTGFLYNYDYLHSNKRHKVLEGVTFTSAWLDNGVLQSSSNTPTTTVIFDGQTYYYDNSDQEFQDATGIDPEWLDFMGDFLEAALDAALLAFTTVALNVVAPGGGVVLALARAGWTAYMAVMGVKWGFDTGQALYALATGTDPTTGRELSRKEYLSLVAGMLGGFVGAFVGGFAGRVAGRRMSGVLQSVREPTRQVIGWQPKKPQIIVDPRTGLPTYNPHGGFNPNVNSHGIRPRNPVLADLLEQPGMRESRTIPGSRPGSRGHPDHVDAIAQAEAYARSIAGPNETVHVQQRVRGFRSSRIADVQIRDAHGNTQLIIEIERHPNHRRNRNREAEYRRLGIPFETWPL